MNRRKFIGFSTAALVSLTFPLFGCNTTTVAQFVTLIGKDAAALATYFNSGTLAQQILSLSAQIATDITNWQSGGGTAAAAIQAINDLLMLITQIPVASSYAPLVTLILSALSGLLALLPGVASPSTRSAMAARNIVPNLYKDFSKPSMTAAKKDFQNSWASLSQGLPLK